MASASKALIDQLTELGEKKPEAYVPEDRALFAQFREATNFGHLRAAEKREDGTWAVNVWYKKALLAGFRLGQNFEIKGFLKETPFIDKHTLPPRAIQGQHKVRVVPERRSATAATSVKA